MAHSGQVTTRTAALWLQSAEPNRDAGYEHDQ